MLMPGTMPLYSNSEGYKLAQRKGAYGQNISVGSISWTVYDAELTRANLRSKDKTISLSRHIKRPPMSATVGNYLEELHNAIFFYPSYAGAKLNYHRSFAWGEGVTGIDEQHGQDISNFVYKLMLGFDLRLPRYSGDQIAEGLGINTIAINHNKGTESHYQTLVKECTLGRIASFTGSAHMVCVGSLSMQQLESLDARAASDARNNGMKEEDLIPLVATSPVGFRDVTTGNWTIIPKAAVFPIFKAGPYSSWIARDNDFKVFSFFKNSPKLTAKTEL